MRNFLLGVVVNWISLLLLNQFLPYWIRIKDWKVALMAGFVLALLNALVRPILMVLAIPLNFITLGLFTFLINAFILYLTQYFVKGFLLPGSIGIILLLSIILGVLNSFLLSILKGKN